MNKTVEIKCPCCNGIILIDTTTFTHLSSPIKLSEDEEKKVVTDLNIDLG